MRRPSPLPSLFVVVLAISALACMCGGPSDPAAVGAAVEPSGEQVASEAAPVSATVVPAVGGWAASIRGVCEMGRDCGCPEKETVEACETSLGASATAFDAGVLTCIVTLPCAEMCGGGGVRCIEEGAARMSAESAAQHQLNMQIINNYPSGGNCPSGMTTEVDAAGRFVRCR